MLEKMFEQQQQKDMVDLNLQNANTIFCKTEKGKKKHFFRGISRRLTDMRYGIG